jgi:proton-translocating NADH-quinone oxidoreductase chain N
MPTLLVIVPLLGVLALNLPIPGLSRIRAAFWFGLALCAWQAVMVVRPPQAFWDTGRNLPLFALNLPPTIDNTALVMFLSIAIVGAVSLLVARHTVADAGRLFNFSNLLVLAVAGMNGMILAGDLFSLYIFLEVTAVASFVLIAFERGRDAFEGAFKYIVLSAAATAMILAAIALLMMASKGGISFTELGSVWASGANRGLVLAAAALFLAGLAIKSGLVPFHGWLPDAYSAAPAAVSILLAGVATKVCGIYALLRLTQDVFAPSGALGELLMLVGTVSIVVGALAALRQSDFKRLLAYSSISQVGYIILALGCGITMMTANPLVAELAFAGAVFHLFNHAILKSLMFVNSAALEQRLGTTDMNRLAGLGSKMPVTGITSLIGLLSTAGVPPLSGFWSKLIIIVALWQANYHIYAAIAVLFSVVTLAYFLLMQRKIFFGRTAAEFGWVQEESLPFLVPELALSGLTLGLGLALPLLFDTFMLPVKHLF